MSDLESAYRLEYFEEEGFHRRECVSCGAHFWTRDGDRETCGEPPCEDYQFIDNPGFDASYSLTEMRSAMVSYFERAGHDSIDPYPVAANRWRDDVLLTQASIYDFQPHVTSGASPPPANPLVVSQPCIRMQDIDNVGKTGRHTMAFEMLGHHAFNADEGTDYAYDGEVYWKDTAVEHCEGLLADVGVSLDEVTFIEDPWVGGGNAGAAFEVIYRGLELATLVFMSLERDPDGEYEMKDGHTYAEMDRRVVDTGYGVERWTWMSQGTPTVYEAVYPDTIDFLKEQAGIEHTDEEAELVHRASKHAGNLDIDEVADIEDARAGIAAELGVDAERLTELVAPLEDIYAIADHSRVLAYMFGDGIVPSNVGTGYLARMVLRRTKRLVDDIGADVPLDELVDMQADRLGYENRDTIRSIVRSEVEKYGETLERGGRRVEQLAEEYADRGEPVPTDELIELYDSHGIQPGMVADIAADVGATVDAPDDFYSLVAARHDDGDSGAAGGDGGGDDRLADLPETETLYYDDAYGSEFEAVVLDVFEREGEDGDGAFDVVLDQTMFYPEGGGQPADTGVLTGDDHTVDVIDVQERDGVVLHRTTDNPGKGEFVRGQIDTERRRRLMAHHTATHIVVYAARQVLGEHVRQAGAQKGVDSSRIDVTHYERVDRETVKEIERVANEIVRANTSVQCEWPDRHEAEAEYGFDLYQGGIPAGEQIRLVHVDDDVQACGGTHVARTGEIGSIKILNAERVQDGVERLTFAAGAAAVEHVQGQEDDLRAAAEVLDVTPAEVPETAERFFTEWKDRGKTIDDLKEQLAEARASGGGAGEEVDVAGTTAVVQRVDGDMDELQATANALVDGGQVAVVGSGADGAQFVVGVPDGVPVNAGEVVGELAAMVGGGGGGPPDFAQGGGPDAERLDDALSRAADVLGDAASAE
ncbi:alanine--tRNA ligase [Halobacterium salinarum]|uniref:Alanine--tRNA ligase n=5 Tax=Halobacterium salinarum TaxID=2242 RepID=SYA_HALSA|nr:alanine--tRNA ligase [Halobacterium salinarum]B0R7I0.1 RecName: Full=Alanine--tRNA ligase; AltName: Full=Alanyl-tRNA synthetase; Short=AlaRS [Halobacterium salinarum R1]Q9HN24.1 RecName: Full=Alanine--tRNA ligase; AltName: Full=Alanyl-tRNA synthetase; Short=AlaRS [Halobacterium salinarum NRC-1]AAG20397.1 alanyl-tRNA synthetase [Halobacterium salinarum NRC-1]MBB6089677.1 alanyl-tRNA synthetase [Halobacterium salinarum]MDL0119857.1 alanine--tRNA ligase [Halobacterium salinarum]MDL0130350.1 a